MFFDARKYDFSRVGRLKFNIKLYENQDATHPGPPYADAGGFLCDHPLSAEAAQEHRMVDDIDHLGKPARARSRRADGESVPHRLVRMERAIKEKMSVYQELSTAMPHDLINAKPVMAAIREFFRSSQLSQFHGSDQSVVGDHAQEAPFGTWTGRLCRVSARALRCATYTRRTTVAFARLRRRKARTSA